VPRKAIVTGERVAELLEEVDRPFVDSVDIAEYLNVTAQAVRNNHQKLAESPQLESGDAGQTKIYWLSSMDFNSAKTVLTSGNTKRRAREKPRFRKHETYEQDHWTVVDIAGVDKVFATPALDDADETVRVDLDGIGAESTFNDELVGENINTSIWMKGKHATELVRQIESAISTGQEKT